MKKTIKDANQINPNTATKLLAFHRGSTDPEVFAEVIDPGKTDLTKGEIVSKVKVTYSPLIGFELAFHGKKGDCSFYVVNRVGLKPEEIALRDRRFPYNENQIILRKAQPQVGA